MGDGRGWERNRKRGRGGTGAGSRVRNGREKVEGQGRVDVGEE